MKFLLLASFVLFCTASTVYRGSRNIAVNDDGTVLVTSQYGKRVMINREILPTGEKNIDITISGLGFPTKTVQIRDTFYNNQIGSQGDILTQILKEYQGVVDEAQYEKLLYKINQAVTRGQISPQVYELFENLDQQTQGVQFGQGQVQGQQQAYGLNGVYGYNQYQQYTPQTQYQQLYSNQVPFVRSYGRFPYTLGSKYYASSRYVNPLLEKIFGTTQGTYITDLLANQQLNGGIYGNVPQTYFSRVFGKNYVPLNQYYQQGFYGQRQTVPQVYGVQQTLAQYNEIPQTVQQQQIEQAVQQYSVGQQQQRAQQAVQQFEQLVESQQQEQFVEQLQQQQQQFAEQIQQQQQQQQFVDQIQQQQQQQQFVEQLQQQQQQQYNSVPLSLQQLVGAMQTVGQFGGVNSYYYKQPYTGYVARQPYNVQGTYYNTVPHTFFNTVPQVQAVY